MHVFAWALGAARNGDVTGARREIERLRTLHKALNEKKLAYWTEQTDIQAAIATAWALRVEGKDAEYNEWYTNTHLGEILAIPGFKGASRYKVAPRPTPVTPTPKHQYLALYTIESDDPEAVLGELRRRSSAGMIKPSAALDRSTTSSVLYELIAEKKA